MAIMDYPIDNYYAAVSGSQNPIETAIHYVLSENEIRNKFDLYQGSGGICIPGFSVTVTGGNVCKFSETPTNKFELTLNTICSTFALTMEELADVCNVSSRKTPYNWKDGKLPRKVTLDRIFKLALLAKNWKDGGFSNNKIDLLNPVVKGKSVLELLKEPDLQSDLVLFAGVRLKMLEPPINLDDPFGA